MQYPWLSAVATACLIKPMLRCGRSDAIVIKIPSRAELKLATHGVGANIDIMIVENLYVLCCNILPVGGHHEVEV